MTRRAAAALVLALAACSPSEPKVDAGAMRDGVYHNDYFRLTLPIPANWTVEKDPSGDWTLDNLLSLLAASDSSITDSKEIPRRKRFLLQATSNMTFVAMGTAEMGAHTDIRIGSHCLKRVVPLLTAGKRPFRVTDEPRRLEIGGFQFDTMAFRMRLSDGEIHQRVYAVVRWGYALVVVAGSSSPEGLKRAEAVVEKVLYTPKPDS